MIEASALTYVTVLSLVPLLAFAFAMLKGLGFYDEFRHQRIDPFLDRWLLGGASDVTATPNADPALIHGAIDLRNGIAQVLDLVEKTDLKALGFVGLIVLLAAVIRLLGSIEGSFNEIWGVRKARSWVRKLSDYMTMVIVTPMFLVVAIGVTTAAQNRGVSAFFRERLSLGFVIEGLLHSLPLLLGWLAFTLMYLVMPNRRGKFSSAALGGFVAATLWQLSLVIQIQLQIGIANYSPIYASFAALPVFLVWVQTSWVIVLFGAELAFAHESEPEYRGIAAYQTHYQAFKEQVALRALTRISAAFLSGSEPPNAGTIAAQLGISPREVREIVDQMQRGGLVAPVDPSAAGHTGFLPARDPGLLTIVDVLAVLRGEGRDARIEPQGELDRHVDRLQTQLDAEARSSAFNRTLRDLVEETRKREAALHAEPVAQTSVQPS
jgi:membrane protein